MLSTISPPEDLFDLLHFLSHGRIHFHDDLQHLYQIVDEIGHADFVGPPHLLAGADFVDVDSTSRELAAEYLLAFRGDAHPPCRHVFDEEGVSLVRFVGFIVRHGRAPLMR